MKVALIAFHKNIQRYPLEWISAYRDSVLNQTYRNFDIVELNYGGTEWIFNSNRIMHDMETHAHAHNYLVKWCFENGYDYVLNSNVDDVYPLDRIQAQVDAYNESVAVCSGGYILFNEAITNVMAKVDFSTSEQPVDVAHNFSIDNNVVAHPACAYSKAFYEYMERTGDGLMPGEIPADDFSLWKRMLASGEKFNILPQTLLYYRYHAQKAS